MFLRLKTVLKRYNSSCVHYAFCPLAEFYSLSSFTRERKVEQSIVTSAHRTPQRHDFFNVFSKYKRNHMCIFSDYLISLTVNIQNVLISCFRPLWILYVRSTFHYRTICELQNSFDSTAFCCTFSFAAVFCFISHFFKMCTNMLEFNQIHYLLLSPTLSCLPQHPETVECGVFRPAYGYTTASYRLRFHTIFRLH